MRAVAAVAMALTATGGCGDEASPTTEVEVEVEALVVRVVAEYPHDTSAFTQGLLLHDDRLYESAGQYGQSSLREVDPQTGAVIRQVDVPASFFAEGLALVDDRLIQLTWQEGTAFVYDIDTFEQVDTFSYPGEGWGLCETDDELYMSDGSGTLTVRDPDTFEGRGTIEVKNQGESVDELNELECVGERVYANVRQTDTILEIDPTTGDVVAEIDASGLLDASERDALPAGAVLNGIAAADNGRLYLTGKYWPLLFEVELVPA